MIPGTALPRLALFKLGERVRRWSDEHGGWGRAVRREDAWARSWSDRIPDAASWLERPGGGRFWLAPEAGRRWARRYCTEGDLTLAADLRAGRLRFLGFDPADIGTPPRWRRDLYTGHEWPLEPAGRLSIVRGDGSDIRTIWELSRGYHLVPLAKAWRRSGDPGLLDLFRSHVDSWLDQNPPGLGPNWCSSMDVGIRSANWILALILLADSRLPATFWARMLANLRLSAWSVERHLEWHPSARGNHYIANAVGLVYVGALFADEQDGQGWLRLGARILREEMAFQVHPDGVSYEAALAYHRLVTELFSFGGEVIQLNLPDVLPPEYWSSLGRMYEFLEAYLPESGEAPMLGDADDGRLHALCAEALTQPRRHRLGLRFRNGTSGSVRSGAFRDGGFFVLRGGGGHLVIRCGPVGLGGAGCHDHNDQLSCELTLDGRRVLADSGTYAYTRDLTERYGFRSTAAHSAIQLGGEEQNPIRVDRPWRVLADRTRAECLEWENGPRSGRFVGRHTGYAHRESGAVCYRTVIAEFDAGTWTISDRVEGRGAEDVTWRLHFTPGDLRVIPVDELTWAVEHAGVPGYRFRVASSAVLRMGVEQSRMSDRYGVSELRPVLVARGQSTLPLSITFRAYRHPEAA